MNNFGLHLVLVVSVTVPCFSTRLRRCEGTVSKTLLRPLSNPICCNLLPNVNILRNNRLLVTRYKLLSATFG